MVFGYSTNAFVRFSLESSIERIARLGFRGVEIMGDRPHLYPPDYPEAALSGLKAAVEKNGLKITNLNSFTLFAVGDTYLPSWIEPEPERRALRIRHTLDCLRAAAFLDCPNISIPPGGPLQGMGRRRALSLFHEGLEQVIPLAESLGVSVLVEPEPDLMIERTGEFLEFIRDVRSPRVGVNFDMGHFFCAGEDPRRALDALFPWVGHVHLEDIAASREHRHLIPGHGAIDFPAVLEGFRSLGYTGDISLELYPYVDTPEEAGRESLDFLAPLFEAAGIDLQRQDRAPL